MKEEEGATPEEIAPKIAAAKQDLREVYLSPEHPSARELAGALPGPMSLGAGSPLHRALMVDADGAAEFASRYPGFYVFPGEVTSEVDPATGSVSSRKRPLCAFTKQAVSGPGGAARLWRQQVGRGSAAMCINVGASGIWALDEDRDLAGDSPWRAPLRQIADERLTLILRSCSRGRPHYLFRQGTAEEGDYVVGSNWEAGEVKAGNAFLVISDYPPIVDAPVGPAPCGVLELVRKGRPSGIGHVGRLSRNEAVSWLDDTPADDERLIEQDHESKFVLRVVDRFWAKVEAGEHRRIAARGSAYAAAIEAAAGLYSAREAFEAIGDAYAESRELDRNPAKRWTDDRRRDYLRMWADMASKISSGALDDEIAERRAELIDRLDIEEADDDSEAWLTWLEGLGKAGR